MTAAIAAITDILAAGVASVSTVLGTDLGKVAFASVVASVSFGLIAKGVRVLRAR